MTRGGGLPAPVIPRNCTGTGVPALWSLLRRSTPCGYRPTPCCPHRSLFSFRAAFVQYTGTIGMGLMSAAMPWPRGRDGWCGRWVVSARCIGCTSGWASSAWASLSCTGGGPEGTKWMVGWGWLSRPAKGPPSGETLPLFESGCAVSAGWPSRSANGPFMPPSCSPCWR